MNAPVPPVEPKPAASVLLVRDAPAGAPEPLEVYMIRRNRGMKFLGGYYAFPGGKVDPAEVEPHPLHRALLRQPAAGGPGAAALHGGDVGRILDSSGRRLPPLPVRGDEDGRARGVRARLSGAVRRAG